MSIPEHMDTDRFHGQDGTEVDCTESDRRVYEIINPSDPYSLVTDSREVAAAACLMLGQGAYSLKEVGSDWSMPLFLLGDIDDVREWWSEEFGGDFEGFPESHLAEIAYALQTVMIGDPKNRGLEEMPDNDQHDQDRTSMNDIGRKAWSLAEKMLE